MPGGGRRGGGGGSGSGSGSGGGGGGGGGGVLLGRSRCSLRNRNRSSGGGRRSSGAGRTATAIVVWLAIVAAAALIAVRSRYVADLSAFLPSSPTAEQAVLLDQLQSGIAARLVLAGIEGGTAEARSAASIAWARELRGSGLFDSVNNGDNAPYAAFGQFLFDHRYLLSPAVDADRYTAAGLRAAIDDTVSLLGTPAGAAIKGIILRDPTGETVRMAEGMLASSGPRTEGGVWVSRTAARAVLIATTHADGADLDGQERAIEAMRRSFEPHAAQGLRLVISGAGTFAVASRAQIKQEVERLALAGSVAIVALLLVAFGSLRSLAIALLPVATGVAIGIATVSLVFGQVHGITLGFGTTLIGEAVDYAIYYLIQARPAHGEAGTTTTGARIWIARSWPTVRLGLLTSLFGFAALVFSGFPGLAQLGVFSVAGLVAAALTTRHVFPVLAPNGAPGLGLRRQLGRATGWMATALPRLRWPLAALPLLALPTLLLLPSPWHGSLGSLSPVGAAAMRLDAELRSDVGASDTGTLVALSAPDEAGVLTLAEQAGVRIDRLVGEGALQGYDSPARLLPSRKAQSARQQALPDTATLRARLAEATVDGPLNADRLDGFIADVEAARQQPLLDRRLLQGTPLAPVLDAMLIAGQAGRPWRALLSLQPAADKPLDTAKLRAALADLPGARLINIGDELGGLYATYLHRAMLQSLLGASAIVLLLGLQLRSWRRLLRIAEPIAAAVLIVIAAFAVLGAELGILHLVGLLLVVAIGSNYALFFDQLRQGGRVDNDTLASLALANLTLVISFGLLAFSAIPALNAIGRVVAPGTLLCLLLAAAYNPPARPGAVGRHDGLSG